MCACVLFFVLFICNRGSGVLVVFEGREGSNVCGKRV
jgi:hypothetical protein